MPRLDPAALPRRTGTIYPPPLDRMVAGRSSIRLGEAGGLTQFGVNIVILAPGARSSMRHWHEEEDEFVMILEGRLDWHCDAGAVPVAPGDCLAFPKGDRDAHCFVNTGTTEARFLVVGSKAPVETAHYPDQGLKAVLDRGTARFFHADGRPWSAE